MNETFTIVCFLFTKYECLCCRVNLDWSVTGPGGFGLVMAGGSGWYARQFRKTCGYSASQWGLPGMLQEVNVMVRKQRVMPWKHNIT